MTLPFLMDAHFRNREKYKARVRRRAEKIQRIRTKRETQEAIERDKRTAANRREKERIAEEASRETRRLQEEAAREQARARSEAHAAMEAQRHHETQEMRLRELIAQYEPFPDYANPAFLEAYARRHLQALLCDERQILGHHQQLHASPEFVDLVKSRAPDTYERATWKVRALAIAKRLEVEGPLSAPPQDVIATKTRELEDKAEGEIQLAEVRIRKVNEMRQRLEQYEELDPDTREMMIQRFADSLEAGEELPGTVY